MKIILEGLIKKTKSLILSVILGLLIGALAWGLILTFLAIIKRVLL